VPIVDAVATDRIALGARKRVRRKQHELDLRIEFASVIGFLVVLVGFGRQPEPTVGGGIRRIVGRH
jgi:hypothetical protein